jgi:hypothetical protein
MEQHCTTREYINPLQFSCLHQKASFGSLRFTSHLTIYFTSNNFPCASPERNVASSQHHDPYLGQQFGFIAAFVLVKWPRVSLSLWCPKMSQSKRMNLIFLTQLSCFGLLHCTKAYLHIPVLPNVPTTYSYIT